MREGMLWFVFGGEAFVADANFAIRVGTSESESSTLDRRLAL